MQPKITEGLTKNQVKNIIKIAKKQDRIDLQGLIWEADAKLLSSTDGYYAVSWDLGRSVIDEFLPKSDGVISYKKLNAWQVNASSKDILKWDELLKMVDNDLTPPKLSHLLDPVREEKVASESCNINPRILEKALSLVEDDLTEISTKLNNTVLGLYIETKDKLVPQYILVMGLRKN